MVPYAVSSMRRTAYTIAMAAAAFAPIAACSFFVDTGDLSGGANDAGISGDSAIGAETSTESSALTDASDEDTAAPPSSTLVQERGTSASSTNTVTISVAQSVAAGNSLLLAVAASEEDPTSVTGGGTWNQIARSGTHIATSLWLATGTTAGDTSITVTWSATETDAAVLLMEWTGTLKKELDIEVNGDGTSLTAGPIASSAGDVLLGVVGMHNHTVGAPAGGFDLVNSVALDDLQLLVAQSAPGAGTFSTGWTAVTGDGWDSLLVALTGN